MNKWFKKFQPYLFVSSVLPEAPIVLDRWGREINGTVLGPLEQDDSLIITCRTIGGILNSFEVFHKTWISI